ncbi:hypothetical protein [Photobacterium lipolyticum]|uniref:Uncharacterized protein n=1 Tax=Photobacterium lipolyticum TaxID=266810 RepID=A0A2T3N1Y1_9GAMM|nr:hypothetical protein [Photobacterium lipolyticum]PSW06322.1 hypothetical protein C9I89_07395 [Photobacterium lipolyticum]
MKVMKISWADLCGYGEWLSSPAAIKFANDDYTHVETLGEIVKCEISYTDDGTPQVGLGELMN